MKLGIDCIPGIRRALACCALAVGAFAFAGLASSPAAAAPVPAEVRITNLRAIQTYNIDKKADDDVYLIVTGVAKGQEVPPTRVPKDKPWAAAPKKPPVTDKEPLTLWKGELNDGEFALLTVTVMQGKGADEAKVKEYLGNLTPALAKAAERSKKTLADKTEARKLATNTVKAEQVVITKIKDTFDRAKNTDHFGGLFNVLVWNNEGKIVKRVDPVGLTFGEHYGTNEKVYTKIKRTLKNVYTEVNGEWALERMEALGDDDESVRVKMLETEYVKTPERLVRNTTDYLADVQVLNKGKPQKWSLGGENPPPEGGDPVTHTFWDFAE